MAITLYRFVVPLHSLQHTHVGFMRCHDTRPHSRTPTRPRLDDRKPDLMVRLPEIFYARERGQWHARQSDPCTSQRAPPLMCTPTPQGAQRLRCEPDVALDTCSLIFRRLLRQTRRKEERGETNGKAGARGEGSPRCEWMQHRVT